MYGELDWMKVKSLIRQGHGYKPISRMLAIDWRTVKKLALMNEAPRTARRERTSLLDKFKPIIEAWLADDPRMRASVIEHKLNLLGFDGSYSIVKRYVREKKDDLYREATVRFETLPGEQAQVDFAEVRARYVDGRTERVSLFFFGLGFSRWIDADITCSQRRKALMHLLEKTFWEIGGVSHEILFDNLTPVAKRARTLHSHGELAEEWRRFEFYYGFETRLSMAYRAQTKGKIERPIDPVKRFLESQVFLSRDHLRDELSNFTRKRNNTVHSTTQEKPVERLKKEKAFLRTLPPRPLDFAKVERRRVSKDCFVSVEGIKYSVPWEYVKKEIEVRLTSNEVQLFTPKGSLIASHMKMPQSLRDKYGFVVQEAHYQGLPGSEEAFSSLRKLNEMGYGPFYVEKRSLSEYQEAVE